MIKINLAQKKQASFVEGKNKTSTMEFSSITKSLTRGTDLSSLKEFPLKKILLSVILIVVSSMVVDDLMKSEMITVEQQIQKLQVKQNEIRALVAKTNGYQEIKKQLDDDEHVLQTKITSLKAISKTRASTSRMLIDLSKSIPEEAWLDEFKLESDGFSFSGYATDYNYISDFMRSLESSAFFNRLELEETTQEKTGQVSKFTYFNISGSRVIE